MSRRAENPGVSAEKALGYLRSKGVRITKAREEIVKVVCSADSAVTVSEILNKLRAKKLGINKTTAYREVDFLLGNQLIARSSIRRGVSHYESAALRHRHMLICSKCGKLGRVRENSKLEKVLGNFERSLKKLKFKVQAHKLEFYGCCRKCL